jgi:cobalt-zinc-cadmium efflux system membrane fusion protein
MYCARSLRATKLSHLLMVAATLAQGCSSQSATPQREVNAHPFARANETVELTAAQLRSVSVQPVSEQNFVPQRDAVGNIDFNEDMTVQVSPPYQGRVVQLFAKMGDAVRRGQPLFTIESPDLVQAASTLISAAGVLKLTSSVLERATGLYAIQGIAQKEYEQAVSDQQAAAGAYQAARDAVRIFGKSDAEMDRMVESRQVDAQMYVHSPIAGVVTARNAAPGTLVQPGGTPAPYAIADIRTKWLLAQVPEADVPALRLGQEVEVTLFAYPGRVFRGSIVNVSEAVDPNTRRATVRSQVEDPADALRPQMFANFTVRVGAPVPALAVPVDAVVREGDGTMSVWVTRDRQRFTRRTVRLAEQQGGFDRVVDGVRVGELIAATGALFISNASIQGGAD